MGARLGPIGPHSEDPDPVIDRNSALIRPLLSLPEVVDRRRVPSDTHTTRGVLHIGAGELQLRCPPLRVILNDSVLAGVDDRCLLLELVDRGLEPAPAFGGELASLGEGVTEQVPALLVARRVGPQHEREHTSHSHHGSGTSGDQPFTHRVLQGVRPLHCATTTPRQGGPGWLLNGLCRCASTSWSATMSETPSRRAGQPHQSGTPPRNPGRRSTGSKPSAWTWAAPWSPPPVSVPRRSQDGRHPRSPLVSPTTRSSRPLAALWRP